MNEPDARERRPGAWWGAGVLGPRLGRTRSNLGLLLGSRETNTNAIQCSPLGCHLCNASSPFRDSEIKHEQSRRLALSSLCPRAFSARLKQCPWLLKAKSAKATGRKGNGQPRVRMGRRSQKGTRQESDLSLSHCLPAQWLLGLSSLARPAKWHHSPAVPQVATEFRARSASPHS